MFDINSISNELIIIAFSTISTYQCILYIFIDQKKFGSGLSSSGAFYICSLIYCAIMPFISIVSNYHFVIYDYELEYYSYFCASIPFINFIFYLSSKLKIRNYYSFNNKKQNDNKFAYIGIIIGCIALFYFLAIYKSIFNLAYHEITDSLRGEGWVIRTIELIPTSGLILFIQGIKTENKKLKSAGLLCIMCYSIFRIPLQNRENIFKYYVILLIALYYNNNKKFNIIKTLSIYLSIISSFFIMPLMATIRHAKGNYNFREDYAFFLFRDINFSEVAATIMANSNNIGHNILQNLLETFSILIPKFIWENKPYPISVKLTSLIAKSDYNIYNPNFSYAPMFIGWGYSIGGFILIFLTSLLIGVIAKTLENTANKNNSIIITTCSIITYAITFSSFKTDPGITISSIIIQISFLFSCIMLNHFSGKNTISRIIHKQMRYR